MTPKDYSSFTNDFGRCLASMNQMIRPRQKHTRNCLESITSSRTKKKKNDDFFSGHQARKVRAGKTFTPRSMTICVSQNCPSTLPGKLVWGTGGGRISRCGGPMERIMRAVIDAAAVVCVYRED
jgi:hypothetical protein